MINSATHQQPANHQPVQNYSRRGGQSSPNSFQPQHNQNNQLQQLLNLLLPLLQQLISNLGNNDGNNQHCNNQCDSKPPQELKFSDNEKERLSDAIYTGTFGVPGNRIIDSIIDKDCSGTLSVGDMANVSIFIGETDDQGNAIAQMESRTITQDIVDKYNAT